MRKFPPTNVHRILTATLSPEQQADFVTWARWQKYDTIRDRVIELSRSADPALGLPESVSRGSVTNWFDQTYPPGEAATPTLATARTYSGLRHEALTYAEMAIACTAANLERVQKLLEQTDKVDNSQDISGDTQLDPEQINTMLRARASLFYNAHNFAKELRTGAVALHEAKLTEERRSLELAGGYRVAEILRVVIKGGNLEAQVNDAITAALLQLEQETQA